MARADSELCCTRATAAAPAPGCTAPGYWCEAHHDDGWAAAEAPTDINTMSLACPADNKLIEKTGWRPRKRADGRTEWIPPPNLDWGHLPACKGDGQARVNNYHHPQRFLIPDEHDSRDGRDDDDESDC